MVLVGGRAGEIYNIGGGTELTNKELTAAAARRDRQGLVVRRPRAGPPGPRPALLVDISKIQRELGYEPQVPFEQGLADVVQWYRDNRAWWEPLKERAALVA